MAVSIYNSIRTSKVTTGNSPQYQGMRTFDSDAQVCPSRGNISDYGIVGVSRDSINTYTAGCFSPEDRIVVENVQRPRYSTYLNASAIAMAGAGDDDLAASGAQAYQNKPYDTQLGGSYVRPILSDAPPVHAFKQGTYGNDGDKINCIMDRLFDSNNCSASGQ